MAVYDAEYRRMAKAANQRLVTFERQGMYSPAVLRVKAQLSMAGRRRFSETGKAADQDTINAWKRDLQKFLYEDVTSTKAGYRKYREDILTTSQELYNYKEAGLSNDDWLKIWEALPDDKTQRLYGSDVYIAIVEEARKKKGKKGKLDIEKLISDFEAKGDYDKGLKAIGVSKSGVNKRLRQFSAERDARDAKQGQNVFLD